MMCRLKPLVVICVAVFLAGCAGGPQTQPPTVNLRRLNNPDSPLALSARLLERVSDSTERLEIANDIAAVYIRLGMTADAAVMIDYSQALFPFTSSTPESVVAVSRTAILLGRVGRSADAVALLDLALQRSLSISSDQRRGEALEAIIAVLFAVGDESFDLLTTAVQSIFVIEDLWVRVRLLTSTAVLYHTAGNRGTMNSLMQQAIPAAGSLPDPWRRAAAISEIAAAYHRAGNRDAAINAIDNAMNEVRRIGNGPADAADAPYALHAVSNVVLLAQQLAAVELIDRIVAPRLRARGLADVAVSYGEEQARSAAYIFFSRAVREASLVEDEPGRVEAMTDVAFGYLQIGDTDLAVIQANGAGSVSLQIADAGQQIAAGTHVMEVYAQAGEVARAVSLLEELPEGAVRDRVGLHLIRFLLDNDRQSDALDLLRQRFPSKRPGQSDELASAIAIVHAEAGDVERALHWLDVAGQPELAARTLLAVGRQRPTTETMSEPERELFAAIRAASVAR